MDIHSIEQSLLEQRFLMCSLTIAECHDSLFESISELTTCFDGPFLRKEIACTFYNSYHVANDTRAINCFNRYLSTPMIQQVPLISNWQGYIVNLSIPYEHGHIEGSYFAIQWICEILDLNIYLWSIESQTIDIKFHATNASSKVLYLMRKCVIVASL